MNSIQQTNDMLQELATRGLIFPEHSPYKGEVEQNIRRFNFDCNLTGRVVLLVPTPERVAQLVTIARKFGMHRVFLSSYTINWDLMDEATHVSWRRNVRSTRDITLRDWLVQRGEQGCLYEDVAYVDV